MGRWAAPTVLPFAVVGAAGVLLVTAIFAPADDDPRRVQQLASASLSDDDGGAALFDVAGMRPGHAVTRCLRVGYVGSSEVGVVRLVAQDLTGRLTEHLQLDVAVGVGGSFGGCAGFVGTTFYRGPLGGLAGGESDAPGVSAGWRPRSGEHRTYRITVTLVDDAAVTQRMRASATFRWLLFSQDPGSLYRPTPHPEHSSASTEPTMSTEPTTGPSESSIPPADSVGPSGGSDRGTSLLGRLRDVVGQVVEATLEIAARTLKHAGFPAGSVLAVLMFLLVQNRIDRRDPKLALAPLWPDRHMTLPDDDADPTGDSDLVGSNPIDVGPE
jgi:hypothetical protein